jgi:A/G-specific adenine glycosylase
VALYNRQIPEFRRSLLRWYRRNRRRLPWRSTRDPYRIWVSEVMLQQTRVPVVLEYYRRFLRRFPTLAALARAPAGEVERVWAGLGYYRRARNLHRAAREVLRKHRGRFPDALGAALRLPGVGRYTARAVLSIAYGAPLAVVDGNVARVLARLDAGRAPRHKDSSGASTSGPVPIPRTALDERAQELLAPNAPGDWNQAMMELGATVCTPRAPRCPDCPVARWCRARSLGIAESLPARRPKRRPLRLRIAAAVLLDPAGRTLLVRSRDGIGALFSGMWHFPAVQVERDARQELARHLARLGIEVDRLEAPRSTPSGWPDPLSESVQLQPLASARHSVTFRAITLEPYLVRARALPGGAPNAAKIVPLARLETLAISNATRKIAAATAGRAPTKGMRQEASGDEERASGRTKRTSPAPATHN